MGSKTGWIETGQEDESSRAGRDGYLGVSGKGEIARHAARKKRRQKRVGCSTADSRIAIIHPLHALRKFFTLSLLGCCFVCNCGHIGSLVLMFYRRMESVTQPALDELGGDTDIILSL